jgi:murein DD-endopeptidase MepM/ murein hydrolase activator NlpD
MIKKNLITLLIQSDPQRKSGNNSSLIKLTFSKRVFYYLLPSVLLLLLFAADGIWSIRNNLLIKSKISKIETEIVSRQSLLSQSSEIRKELGLIRDFLGIAAYNTINDSDEPFGRGGTGPEENILLTSSDFINKQKPLPNIVINEPLLNQVSLLKNNVNEVFISLSNMTEKLNHKPTIMPAKGENLWISSSFGRRKSPFTGLSQFHYGLDISGKKGTDILATADGIIEKTGSNRFIGKYIKIKHDETYSTTYGHLMKINVKKGIEVARGDVIGLMGSTGLSTGNHVHYVVSFNGERVNPYDYVLNRKRLNIASLVY